MGDFEQDYARGEAVARAILGIAPAASGSSDSTAGLTDRQRGIMAHPLAQGRLKGLAEHLAMRTTMDAAAAIQAMEAAATPEERGAATALLLGFGKR